MDFMKRIAEDRIRAAQDEGVFDNLPGKGKPLQLDDDSGIPEDMRLAFKILKNAGACRWKWNCARKSTTSGSCSTPPSTKRPVKSCAAS